MRALLGTTFPCRDNRRLINEITSEMILTEVFPKIVLSFSNPSESLRAYMAYLKSKRSEDPTFAIRTAESSQASPPRHFNANFGTTRRDVDTATLVFQEILGRKVAGESTSQLFDYRQSTFVNYSPNSEVIELLRCIFLERWYFVEDFHRLY